MGLSFADVIDSSAFPDNRSNYEWLCNACKKETPQLRPIPFVGAGLSMPEYPGWEETLRELAKRVADLDARAKIEELIDAGSFLSAADEIAERRGEQYISQCIADLFDESKAAAVDQDTWNKKALTLLPELFPNGAITTNYDRELKYAYRSLNLSEVCPQGMRATLGKFLDGEEGAIIKIHGTVVRGATDNLVFTKTQYAAYYGDDVKYGPMAEILGRAAETRSLLFLGCSLRESADTGERDRALELFDAFLQRGHEHYAIVEAEKDLLKVDAQVKALAHKGIRPIFYPAGEHSAVRVILEELLNEVDSGSYQSLLAHIGALSANEWAARFVRGGQFVGRQRELKRLLEFCNAPHGFLWWGIIGQGGIGKTRLAAELKHQLDQKNWDVRFLKSDDYDPSNFKKNFIAKNGKHLLVVADYAREHLDMLKDWVRDHGGDFCPSKVRLLLLERDYTTVLTQDQRLMGAYPEKGGLTFSLTEGMASSNGVANSSFWPNARREKGRASAYSDAELLRLSALNSEDTACMMVQFAERYPGERPLRKQDADNLFKNALQRIDPDAMRPLYALFIVDAWMRGDDPAKWSKDELMLNVLKREDELFDRLLKNGQGAVLTKHDLRALHALRWLGTMIDRLPVDEKYARESEPNARALLFGDDANGYWKSLEGKIQPLVPTLQDCGLLDNDGRLVAIRPDLVGEFLVLSNLTSYTDLMPDATRLWENAYSRDAMASFLFRVFSDFCADPDLPWAWFLPKGIEGSLDADGVRLFASVVSSASNSLPFAKLKGESSLAHAAIDWSKRLVTLAKQRRDDRDLLFDAMSALTGLAKCHMIILMYEKAEQELIEVFELLELPDDFDGFFLLRGAETIARLGLLHANMGKSEKAKEELSVAAMLLEGFPRDRNYCDSLLVEVHAGMAMVCEDVGRYADAEAELNAARELCLRLASDGSEGFFASNGSLGLLATIYNNLGYLHKTINRFEDAEVELKISLELRRSLADFYFEGLNSDAAMTLRNLANVHLHMKKYGLSENEYKEALAIYHNLVEIHGAYSFDLAATISEFAALLFLAGRYEEAEIEFVRALRLYHSAKNEYHLENHQGLAMTLFNLAVIYMQSGRSEEAKKAFTEARTLYRQLAQTNPRAFNPVVSIIVQLLNELNGVEPEEGVDNIGDLEAGDSGFSGMVFSIIDNV